jgi:hypothetical protein
VAGANGRVAAFMTPGCARWMARCRTLSAVWFERRGAELQFRRSVTLAAFSETSTEPLVVTGDQSVTRLAVPAGPQGRQALRHGRCCPS